MLLAKVKAASRHGILLLATGFLFACNSIPVPDAPTDLPPASPIRDSATRHETRPVKTGTRVTIAAVGDLMLGTDFPKNHLPDDDGKRLLEPMHGLLQAADITFGNLEGTLLDGGEAEKKCRNPEHCYVFRSPSRYAALLQRAGFDVLSLANNHARDFGEDGRSASMRALDAVGIHHSGRDDDIASWTVKGLKVAMIAFAPFKNSHDLLDLPAAQTRVQRLARMHDIVMISMHAGGEGLDMTRLPFAREYYYNEDRGDVVEFARGMIDAGADIVLGHGPHVPRAVEIYKGRLIAYSLGNFATYYGISVAQTRGLAPLLVATLDESGRFVQGQIHSARQLRPRGPVPDPENAAARLIQQLSRQDFPDTALQISAAGRLYLQDSVARLEESGQIRPVTDR